MRSARAAGQLATAYNRGEIIEQCYGRALGQSHLYVSSGYRVSLPTAIDYVLRCTPKYRLPELPVLPINWRLLSEGAIVRKLRSLLGAFVFLVT